MDYPEEIDCLWLGTDAHGNVGAFVTAGRGPIPEAILQIPSNLLEELERMANELPRTGLAVSVAPMKRPDDFVALAERGLFAYDWSDLHRMLADATGKYELMASPGVAIKLSDLPQDLMAVAECASVEGRFGATRFLDMAQDTLVRPLPRTRNPSPI